MILRNDLSASKRKTLLVAMGGLFGVSFAGSFFPQYLEPQWVVISFAVFGGVVLLRMLAANYHFVMIDTPNQKLRVRYYSIFKMLRRFQAIEFPLDTFLGYSIEARLGGLQRVLILKQRVGNKMGTYPEVNISALSQKELNLLKALLNDRVAK